MGLEVAIKQRAVELGFDVVGIAPISAWDHLNFSREWVDRGYGGEMNYLKNPKRDDPRRILPSAQSVICVGMIYNAELPYSTEVREQNCPPSVERGQLQASADNGPLTKDDSPDSNFEFPVTSSPAPQGWISRYAWGADYHKIMRAKLEQLRAAFTALSPGVETRVFVDTGPIVERAFARLAGIGWTGKNTCLINESKGSWFFLGVMITSLKLAPDLPAPDRCGSCTACIEACPTDALVEPYIMDASRCIGYLTIELKGSIPEQFRSAIGANIVGCDICQDVCPWNSRGGSQESGVRSQKGFVGRRSAATTARPEFQPMQVSFESGVQRAESPNPNPERPNFSLFNPPP